MECHGATDIANDEVYVPSHQPSQQVGIYREMREGLFVLVGFRNKPFKIWIVLEWRQCLLESSRLNLVMRSRSTQGSLPIPIQSELLHLLVQNTQ